MDKSIATSDYKFQFKHATLSQFEMQARRRLYAKRPDIWARDVLGATMWSKQVEVSLSIVENKNTMVAAGHGVGKSWLTAVLACWWIDTHAVGNAMILSTAPSNSQVKNIIWKSIQAMHRESKARHREYLELKRLGQSTEGYPDHPLPGYVTSQATWKTDDGEPIGFGRTPPRGREGDTFQGIHGNVFAIADEAVGCSEEMIDTLQNNTSSSNDRRLLIANPTNPMSYMGRTWNDPKTSQAWKRITISVFDSPLFTDEQYDLPQDVLENMTDQSYVDDKITAYGEDSANFKARVKGEWALDGGMALFSEETLQNGIEALVIPDEGDESHVGFDVSRSENGDYSYVYIAQEGWVYKTHEWRSSVEVDDLAGEWVKLDTPVKTDRRGLRVRYVDRWRGLPFEKLVRPSGEIISEGANTRVHAIMNEWEASQLRIDADGMGTIMVDAMINVYNEEYLLVRMRGGDPSPDRNAWYNQRAYQYAELSRRMKAGEIDIEEDDTEGVHPLVSQLGGIEYDFASGYAESMLIMSKKDMKKKGIKSPDAADAVMYAVANVDVESLLGEKKGRIEIKTDVLSSKYDYFFENSAW